MFIFNFFKKTIKRGAVLDILFILFLSLTPLLWFKGGSIMLGHDNIFPLDPITFLRGRLLTWIEQGFGQSQALIMGTIPIHFIDAIPSFFGFSIQTTQKLVYIFWFFAMGISAYYLAHTLNKDSRIFKLTASVLYMFNFFILQGWFIGERSKFSAYIAFPLILAVFFKVNKNELSVLKGAVINSLILFVFNGGGLFGISLYGGFFVAITVFIIFYSLLGIFRKRYEEIKKIFLLTLLTMLGYVFVNAYFIIPAVSQIAQQYKIGLVKGGGVSGFIDWASEISANASITNILRLQGIADWIDNSQHPYARIFLENPILIAISFLWPLLIMFTLLLYKKREKIEIILYLLLCYLLGIFFVAGTHPPTGFIYEEMMRIIPGSAAFRSPYFKFAPVVFLASSFLIAYFIDYFRISIKRILFILIMLITLIYHFPYFTVDFFSWREGFSTRLNVPSYVFEFGKWINEEKADDRRVLLLPPNSSQLNQSRYKWGYLSFQSLPTFLSNKAVVVNNDRISDGEKKLVTQLYNAIVRKDKNLIRKFTSILDVGYIVFQHDSYFDQDLQISTDEATFQNILTNELNLPLEKKLGEWDIFKLPYDTEDVVFLTENTDFIDGSVDNVTNYYNFSNNTNFFIRGDMGLPSSYYVPKCINCPENNKPTVRFPNITILPDSPLYPLLVLRDNYRKKTSDPKDAVYDSIGFSLKRVNELKDTLHNNKSQASDVFIRYGAVLDDLLKNFNRIENYENRVQVAGDIEYYLEAERNHLLPLLGSNITQGKPIVLFGKAFQKIESTIKAIDPYLFKLDVINNRLYRVSIEEEELELFLKKDELTPVLRKNETIAAIIDDKIKAEIKIDSSVLSSEWLSFGDFKLSKGSHKLLLSFPELPNIIEGLKERKTEFNIKLDNTCFTSRLSGVKPLKKYRVNVNYRNDFSEDLYFYAWEVKEKSRDVITIIKLRAGLGDEELSYLINSWEETRGIEIGVCSKILTADLLNQKMKFIANEILYPSLIFVPKNKKKEIVKDVEVEKIDPTKYKVSFVNKADSSILIFSERFDSGWKLEGFDKNHIYANGYVNGWIIDKKGEHVLTMEYVQQKTFYTGSAISALTLIGFAAYLYIRRKKKT